MHFLRRNTLRLYISVPSIFMFVMQHIVFLHSYSSIFIF